MKLSSRKLNQELYIELEGRLDASWSEFFTEAMLKHVRDGEHEIVIDLSGLAYLSSAGIRALLTLDGKLRSVQGGFRLVNSIDMIRETLRSTGFSEWIDDNPFDAVETPAQTVVQEDFYKLDAAAKLHLKNVSAWRPWAMVDRDSCRSVAFGRDICGFGIGCAAAGYAEAKDNFGEFTAIGGNLAMQHPDERSKPDFLIAEKQFVPELCCIQAVIMKGAMSHLMRFAPIGETPVYALSELIDVMMDKTGFETVGYVVVGEIDGLVGTSLINSPGRLTADDKVAFPGIRDWLRFSGERVYPGEQALICGIASRNEKFNDFLPERAPESGLFSHSHATVFPYRPLKNGRIDLHETASGFFAGASPRSVMHLVNDRREINGLGESSLVRGACWYGEIINPEGGL